MLPLNGWRYTAHNCTGQQQQLWCHMEIQWIDLSSNGDAAGCYHYCNNLLLLDPLLQDMMLKWSPSFPSFRVFGLDSCISCIRNGHMLQRLLSNSLCIVCPKVLYWTSEILLMSFYNCAVVRPVSASSTLEHTAVCQLISAVYHKQCYKITNRRSVITLQHPWISLLRLGDAVLVVQEPRSCCKRQKSLQGHHQLLSSLSHEVRTCKHRYV